MALAASRDPDGFSRLHASLDSEGAWLAMPRALEWLSSSGITASPSPAPTGRTRGCATRDMLIAATTGSWPVRPVRAGIEALSGLCFGAGCRVALAGPSGLGPRCPRQRLLALRAGLGRSDASVSGDMNRLHLSSLAAKSSGFPRSGARHVDHGSCSGGRPVTTARGVCQQVAFSRPLPSRRELRCGATESGWDFAVRPARGSEDHLRGTVRGI